MDYYEEIITPTENEQVGIRIADLRFHAAIKSK
jgi:hypothetical protein